MHESISLFHWLALAGRSVHWADQGAGQKTARHNIWEEQGRRNWEEIVCLHSTSLLLHWRTARSNQSLKLLNKLEPPTPPPLLLCLLGQRSFCFHHWCETQMTYSSRRWQVQVPKRTIPAIHPPCSNPARLKKLNSNLHTTDSSDTTGNLVLKSLYYTEQVPITHASLSAPIPTTISLLIPPAIYHCSSRRQVIVSQRAEKTCTKHMLKLRCLNMSVCRRVPLVVYATEQTNGKFDFEQAQGEDEKVQFLWTLWAAAANPFQFHPLFSSSCIILCPTQYSWHNSPWDPKLTWTEETLHSQLNKTENLTGNKTTTSEYSTCCSAA